MKQTVSPAVVVVVIVIVLAIAGFFGYRVINGKQGVPSNVKINAVPFPGAKINGLNQTTPTATPGSSAPSLPQGYNQNGAAANPGLKAMQQAFPGTRTPGH